MGKVALVVGATGIVGNAIIECISKLPKEEWSTILAVSRRKPECTDSRLVFESIDLEADEATILKKLKNMGADKTTHVFFAAYVHVANWDGQEMWDRNVPLVEKLVRSVDSIAPNLQRIELQTGGKYYGMHLGPVPSPITEATPRHADIPGYPEFYFGQEDYLREFQKGKKWTWTIYRPCLILGITRGTPMTAATPLAVYFLVQKHLGRKALFPGNEANYKGLYDLSNADIQAEFAVWTSQNPAAANEEFNIIDHDTIHYTWEEHWKSIANYFGVEVEEPTFPSSKKDDKNEVKIAIPGARVLEHSMQEYMKDKKEVWLEIVKKYGGDPEMFEWSNDFVFIDLNTMLTWSVHYSIAKAKSIGWNKEFTPDQSWAHTFDKMKNIGMIPKNL